MKTSNLKKQTFSKSAQILILSLLLAIPAWVQGQNWKAIGNTAGATDFIGTNNAQDFRIRTNGTQKAVITTGGNVGIGTATPAAKLDVIGQIKITDGTQGAGKVLTSDANGLASWQTPASGSADAWSRLGNAGTVDGTHFLGTTDNIPLNFRVNNQKAGRIDPTLSNTFFGYQTTGNSAPTGVAGDWNTSFGAQSFYSYTTGYANTAIGVRALYSHTTGIFNCALGVQTLESNTTGNFNTALGGWALVHSTTGSSNIAIGMEALYHNTTGGGNTAIGRTALYTNADGLGNTAVGGGALDGNVSSYFNTAVGASAGNLFEHGYNNVFLGANTNTNADDYFNVIACGQGTIVLNSSTARFGNSATVSYGGWANWTNVSDGRYKKNIKENVPGLAFIDKLRPVTYTLDASELDAFMHKNIKDELSAEGKAVQQKALQEKEKITYTGFIAQEVEASAKELGFDFSGVEAAKNENDVYGLRYAEFVVPLVKAVQELDKENSELKAEDRRQKAEIEMIKSVLSEEQQQKLNILYAEKAPLLGDSWGLEQNTPNPFTEKTTINYSVPASAQNAELKIYSAGGKEMKSYIISAKGEGQIEIYANSLAAGIYNYTLMIDGKAAGSRQMILAR